MAEMQETANLRPRSSLPVRIAWLQVINLGVAAGIAAVFWAVGMQVRIATVLVYALCLGNLIVPVMGLFHARFSGRPFRHKWLVFLVLLLVMIPPLYAVASVAVWLIAPPAPQTLEHLLRTGWKLPCLAMLVLTVVAFAYVEVREKFERRNAELQRKVELGRAQLEVQEQEMQRAREIQQSLLPKTIPQLPGLVVATSWLPARQVGGDYFDVLKLAGNRLAICIADVVGKGVSAALLMASVQATVRAFAQDSDSPAQLCSRVNSVLCGNIAEGKFVTFLYGVLDADARTFKYCNAGHPPGMLVSSGPVLRLDAGGAVLGIFPEWQYTNSTVGLAPGDRLVLFTDGVTEASAADGREFGEEKLVELAKAGHASSAPELNSCLLAQVRQFCNGQFADDVTLLVIAVN